MTLSELNRRIAALRADRDALHDALHALLADETPPAGAARASEATLRGRIRALNDELGPLEMERAEIDRQVKGQPRKREESDWLPEPVTLG